MASASLDATSVIVAVISILSSVGFWQYIQYRSKLKHEAQAKKDLLDNEFKDTLKEQVQALTTKVDILINDKLELLTQIGELKANLMEAQQTIKHLEETLRNHRMQV